jgi:hypothetical protein
LFLNMTQRSTVWQPCASLPSIALVRGSLLFGDVCLEAALSFRQQCDERVWPVS